MMLFRSLGKRPPRFLSGTRPPHVANSSFVLPLVRTFPHRPVEPQLILHAPNVSRSVTLAFRVAILTSFVAHFSPENKFPSHGCQPPLTSSTILRIPTWIGSSTSGIDDNTCSGHPRLVGNVSTAKPRVDHPLAQFVGHSVLSPCTLFVMPSVASFACAKPPFDLFKNSRCHWVAFPPATHHVSVGKWSRLSIRHRSVLSYVADSVPSPNLRLRSRPTHFLSPRI